jgi:hypothetical protein
VQVPLGCARRGTCRDVDRVPAYVDAIRGEMRTRRDAGREQ